MLGMSLPVKQSYYTNHKYKNLKERFALMLKKVLKTISSLHHTINLKKEADLNPLTVWTDLYLKVFLMEDKPQASDFTPEPAGGKYSVSLCQFFIIVSFQS